MLMDNKFITTFIKKKEFPKITGNILDVGCGGIGAIGTIYNNVYGIDKFQNELAEAPNTFYKILLDYSQNNYQKSFFDAVTFYFSFMFMMEPKEKEKVIENAYKDLKNNGKIYIWDINISSAFPNPYGIKIYSDFAPINANPTYYGIKCENYSQSKKEIIKFLKQKGFKKIKAKNKKNYFYIEAQK